MGVPMMCMLSGDLACRLCKTEFTDGWRGHRVVCRSIGVRGNVFIHSRVRKSKFSLVRELTGTWGSEGGGRYTSWGKKKTNWANAKSLFVQVS